MDLRDLYHLLSPLWVLWAMGLFVGIVVWAYWPSRRARHERHAMIPLRDDDP